MSKKIKYNYVMENLTMTPEMENRILEKLKKAEAETKSDSAINNSEATEICSKITSGLHKNQTEKQPETEKTSSDNTVHFRRRWIASLSAAAAAFVVIIGSVTANNLTSRIAPNPSSETTTNDSTANDSSNNDTSLSSTGGFSSSNNGSKTQSGSNDSTDVGSKTSSDTTANGSNSSSINNGTNTSSGSSKTGSNNSGSKTATSSTKNGSNGSKSGKNASTSNNGSGNNDSKDNNNSDTVVSGNNGSETDTDMSSLSALKKAAGFDITEPVLPFEVGETKYLMLHDGIAEIDYTSKDQTSALYFDQSDDEKAVNARFSGQFSEYDTTEDFSLNSAKITAYGSSDGFMMVRVTNGSKHCVLTATAPYSLDEWKNITAPICN